MTQALNLGLLANNLNSSGQLDATDGLTGAVPIANGGTGATSAANALSNLGGIGSSSPTITTPTIATIKSASSSPTVFQNSSGTEIGTLCRAWVNFVGATGTRNAFFNVSSVTRNSTGDFTINFTTALADANYTVTYTGQQTATSGLSTWQLASISQTTNPTSSAVRIQTLNLNTSNDSPINSVAIFR